MPGGMHNPHMAKGRHKAAHARAQTKRERAWRRARRARCSARAGAPGRPRTRSPAAQAPPSPRTGPAGAAPMSRRPAAALCAKRCCARSAGPPPAQRRRMSVGARMRGPGRVLLMQGKRLSASAGCMGQILLCLWPLPSGGLQSVLERGSHGEQGGVEGYAVRERG